MVLLYFTGIISLKIVNSVFQGELMSLTKREIEHIARLARLELTESEKIDFTRDLNRVLNFVEQLNQLDTTGVEPMAPTPPVCNVFRPDRAEPCLDPEKALANAPDRKNNLFKLPKIL